MRPSAAALLFGRTGNWESGSTPERYRHCMRGDRTRDEDQSLGHVPEKTVYVSRILKPGDLLGRIKACAPGIGAGFFPCGKTAAEGYPPRFFCP